MKHRIQKINLRLDSLIIVPILVASVIGFYFFNRGNQEERIIYRMSDINLELSYSEELTISKEDYTKDEYPHLVVDLQDPLGNKLQSVFRKFPPSNQTVNTGGNYFKTPFDLTEDHVYIGNLGEYKIYRDKIGRPNEQDSGLRFGYYVQPIAEEKIYQQMPILGFDQGHDEVIIGLLIYNQDNFEQTLEEFDKIVLSLKQI